MNRSEEAVRIIAELRKTPSPSGSYHLRGQLPDGREIQLFAHQHKRRAEDPDFFLAEVLNVGDGRREVQKKWTGVDPHET